jgi:hypothetical protein
MQVTHVSDHVTHAVIGGKGAIEFGISNSAEFFNILSSTLYKDQILAVVREVLCNAQDAHIEAGCTDRAVELTLTDEVFTVKDFGSGIHLDDMGNIYGTYGNSTKKNDGTQTGGFGLGCKAPFAYTDHFEVTSAHDGVKTIYNLSKSSAQAQGKPGIVPIASFPSQETGLTVSIRIKGKGDRNRFEELIKRIVHNGDMNMKLNDVQLSNINFDLSKDNYLVVNKSPLDSDFHVMVRYGNVIYPVDPNNEIRADYDAVVRHLSKLTSGGHRSYMSRDYKIIFQAPPHSIAVTPSRESLSMQDHTVATLNKLLTDFLKKIETEFAPACVEYAKLSVVEAVSKKNVSDLLRRESQLPGAMEDFIPPTMSDFATMAKNYMVKNYPADIKFRKEDVTRRLTMMAANGLLNLGMVQTFLKEVNGVRREYRNRQVGIYDQHNWVNDWLQRQVIGPLSVKLRDAGIDYKRLYVCDPDDMNKGANFYQSNVQPLVPAVKAKPGHLFAQLPYLRNIIVLSSAIAELRDRTKKHQVFKELGEYPGFLFYHVSKKISEKDAAIEFFKKSGMVVVDLTFRQEWEQADATFIISVPVPRKPTKKGLTALTSIISKKTKGISTPLCRKEDAPRTMEPEFAVLVSIRQGEPTNVLSKWDDISSKYIVELFGAKGGITNNSLMHANWAKKGVKDIDVYAREKVCEYITNSTAIKEYWAYKHERVIETYNVDYYKQDFVKLVYSTALLRKEYSLVNNLTEEDNKYLYMWGEITKYNNHRNSMPEVETVMKMLAAIPLHPANVIAVESMKKNKLYKLIDKNGLQSLINLYGVDSPEIKKVFEILLTILKA